MLGAQLVGPGGRGQAGRRVATALHARLTVADLCALDLSYAPPYSPVMDPIAVAAQAAQRTVEAVA